MAKHILFIHLTFFSKSCSIRFWALSMCLIHWKINSLFLGRLRGNFWCTHSPTESHTVLSLISISYYEKSCLDTKTNAQDALSATLPYVFVCTLIMFQGKNTGWCISKYNFGRLLFLSLLLLYLFVILFSLRAECIHLVVENHQFIGNIECSTLFQCCCFFFHLSFWARKKTRLNSLYNFDSIKVHFSHMRLYHECWTCFNGQCQLPYRLSN